ncbi:class I SAM-dependent methyltransferase [Streptomyces mirabilis]|uniref:class I SAM-dependent methyltransferase n=1 Tax=Streptomyces mirabilis TaxID=68239 RepID=UPI0033B06491
MMRDQKKPYDEAVTDAQRAHWQATYAQHPQMYGMEPSDPARHAADVFREAGAHTVLELGAGHGRDAVFFAREGFTVHATDFSATALDQFKAAALESGVADRVTTTVHDVRDPLPLPDASVDAVFAHMLLCMALSTAQIRTAMDEIARVMRLGGFFVFTVRHIGDAHYRTGICHGDNIYEHGGFAVHFFDEALLHSLVQGWRMHRVDAFEEGELPRRLWRITLVKQADHLAEGAVEQRGEQAGGRAEFQAGAAGERAAAG